MTSQVAIRGGESPLAAAQRLAIELVLSEHLPDMARLGLRLGIADGAKRIRQRLYRLIHPDKNGGSQAANEATRVLGELAARHEGTAVRTRARQEQDFRRMPERYHEEQILAEAVGILHGCA